jgi:hypothetical protein
LSTTKDVQDAILSEPSYASVVNLIDIKYWYYQADGSAYAPKGGQNLAPRQHARLLKPKGTSAQQVYRAVLEYRLRYPDKAVIYSADAYDRNGWAVLMAGGSLPGIQIKDAAFLQAASGMQPLVKDTSAGQWILYNEKTGYIIYNMGRDAVAVDLTGMTGSYEVAWINEMTGELKKDKQMVRAGKAITIAKPAGGNSVLWLKKK